MIAAAIQIGIDAAMAVLPSLLDAGHADDAVDDREEQLAAEFFTPIVKELNPSVAGRASFKWRELRSFADTADLSKSSLTALDAQELIASGDTAIAELCQQFAQQGWPCQPAPPGSRRSGAGRDIRPTWDRIRLRLAEVASGAGAFKIPFLSAGITSGLAAPVRFLEQMAVSAGLPPGSGKFAFFSLSAAVVVVSGAVYFSRNGGRR